MRKLPVIALTSLAVAAFAGAAAAANHSSHVIDVPLPDGSRAHVVYVGEISPEVTIEPAGSSDSNWAAIPTFAGFDRMIAEMNRQSEAMMREVQQMARQPVAMGASPYVASFGNAPAGITSTTIVSYSNQNGTCTRTTQTVSQGPQKPAKVVSSFTGNCSAGSASERSAPSSAPINRT